MRRDRLRWMEVGTQLVRDSRILVRVRIDGTAYQAVSYDGVVDVGGRPCCSDQWSSLSR